MSVELRKAVILSREYGYFLSSEEVGIPEARAYINDALQTAERDAKNGYPWYTACRERNTARFSRDGEVYTTVTLPD